MADHRFPESRPIEIEIADNCDRVLDELAPAGAKRARCVRVPAIASRNILRLVIPDSVCEKAGLNRDAEAEVHYQDGRRALRDIATNVWLCVLGREGTFSAIVEPGRTTAVLGRMVLDELDLVVDDETGTLRPRYPDRIEVVIE
jgi:hypothetical protein